MSERKNILIVGVEKTAVVKAAVAKLSGDYGIIRIEQTTHDRQIQLFNETLEGTRIEACIFLMEYRLPSPYPFDQALLEPLVSRGARFVTSIGASYTGVDLRFLAEHSAVYANTPKCAALRTADSACNMITQGLRGSRELDRSVRAGQWFNRSHIIKDMRKSSLGLIGLGNIGSNIARTMQYMGMKVRYTKRKANPDAPYEFTDLDTLLAESDVICVMCPLNNETRHLIGREQFAKMKTGVIFVNPARGAIVDEQALVDAMESGKVLRAVLDVYEHEPKVHPGLIASERTILTPHCAVDNETLGEEQQLEILANLSAFLTTGVPNTPVYYQ